MEGPDRFPAPDCGGRYRQELRHSGRAPGRCTEAHFGAGEGNPAEPRGIRTNAGRKRATAVEASRGAGQTEAVNAPATVGFVREGGLAFSRLLSQPQRESECAAVPREGRFAF